MHLVGNVAKPIKSPEFGDSLFAKIWGERAVRGGEKGEREKEKGKKRKKNSIPGYGIPVLGYLGMYTYVGKPTLAPRGKLA